MVKMVEYRDVPVYSKFESYLRYSYKCLCIGMHVLHIILKTMKKTRPVSVQDSLPESTLPTA